jgi:uncharacterized protein (DUF362 family)
MEWDLSAVFAGSTGMAPRVALVKGERSHETVSRALDLSGGIRDLLDRPVLVKVNFISTATWDSGATTDPLLVEALVHRVHDLGGEVAVVESDANMTNADKAARATGMLEMCQRNDVKFMNLIREKERIELRPEKPLALGSIDLPRIVLESHIINAPKLKTHSATKVTLGLKNMFGLLPHKWKFRYHRKGIDKVIVDIASVIRPALTVVDGFVGMEGPGPSGGDPVKMDLVVAGRDIVATDVVATRVMGFDPRSIRHISMAIERGLGSWDHEIVGDDLESVRGSFRPP